MAVKPNASFVFADLSDAITELEVARGSPRKVRQAFTQFVDLTQKLTSAMRKDFGRIKGGRWDAAAFSGWNDVTNFFKWLRNQDQHDLPIRISVHERHFYEIPGHPGRLFPFEGTWALDDQTTDKMPSGITFYPGDHKADGATKAVPPVRIEYQYLIQLSTPALRKRLQQIGTTDMHQLAAACFAVMERYHAYFLKQAGA